MNEKTGTRVNYMKEKVKESQSRSVTPSPDTQVGGVTTQASKSALVAFVAQTGNVSTCLSHSFGPYIFYYEASDHLSSNKDIFSSLSFTFPLPMVILANGSKKKAKGIGSACPLPSYPLLLSFMFLILILI